MIIIICEDRKYTSQPFQAIMKTNVLNGLILDAVILFDLSFQETELLSLLDMFWNLPNVPEFLGPNYMLLLLVIIEQNTILTKSSINRKTLVLRISVPNFKSFR